MRVKNVMTRRPIAVDSKTTVIEAQCLMQKHRIRHLLVLDGVRLAGIITDRDVRLNLPSPATSLSMWELNYVLARMTVGDVMTTNVITVEPDCDVRDAASMLLAKKIGALPVLDGGVVVGIVTETDFLRVLVGSTTVVA